MARIHGDVQKALHLPSRFERAAMLICEKCKKEFLTKDERNPLCYGCNLERLCGDHPWLTLEYDGSKAMTAAQADRLIQKLNADPKRKKLKQKQALDYIANNELRVKTWAANAAKARAAYGKARVGHYKSPEASQ